MTEHIVYIGTPDSDAEDFATMVRADFPGLSVFASNDRSRALEAAAHATVLIGHHFKFDEEILERAPKLRWIQSLTTGTDAILKLKALRPEVALTSTRGAHGQQMSELVFLQMLALLRDFPRMQRNQTAHIWERRAQGLLLNKTIAIVGVGAIAEVLAPRCKAFGMQVIGISESKRTPPGFDQIMSRAELRRAASLADFLVLIVPYSPQTEKLVDEGVLAAMKPTGYLINVARGGVLDEEALLKVLKHGRIAGAALDVFRETPLPKDHPLWAAERLIITPHIGGMSDVYLHQVYPLVRDNLRAFLSGRVGEMINLVEHRK